MARILFLAHRIPYPPNKGDKIRSWNFLNHIMTKHEVHAGFFIDDKEDTNHLSFLQEQCASVISVFVPPFQQKMASIQGLFTGKSLTECAYPSSAVRTKIKKLVVAGKIDLIFVYSAAPFAWLPSDICGIPVITDFVDVDSAKWQAYAKQAHWPLSWLYSREAKYLRRFEASVAALSQFSLLVSDDEATLFRNRLPEKIRNEGSVVGIKNGVDCEAFKPSNVIAGERGADTTRLIFTGAMDYQPNVEAVLWFVEHVFKSMRAEDKTLELFIAGGPVAAEVTALSSVNGITVRGRVPNMADEINAADIVIAPLQTARGIQNKVLEGMAMAKPTIATSAANEGINASNNRAVLIADTPTEYMRAINTLIEDKSLAAELGRNARQFVEKNFSWPSSWASLDTIIDDVLLSNNLKEKNK